MPTLAAWDALTLHRTPWGMVRRPAHPNNAATATLPPSSMTLVSTSRAALALLCLASGISFSAHAVTYRYASTAYDRFQHYTKPCSAGTCLELAAGDGVTGFFTTAEPLPANLTENDVILPRITGWAFGNGQTVITHDAPGARVLGFRVATDATGQPTHASIMVSRWADESDAPHRQGDRAQLIAARTSPYNPEVNQVILNAPCSVTGRSAEGVNDTCFGFKTTDGAASTANYARGTLMLDAPLAFISNGRVTEGNAGTASMEFTVTLSSIPTENVSLRWRTADGTATAPADYTASSGTLAWAAGEDTYKTITVPIHGDTTPEPDEVLTVHLSDFIGAAPSTDTVGTGVIINDDGPPPAPQVRISDASTVEGGPDTHTTLRFTVTLSEPPTEAFSIRWRTVDGTATAPGDYTSGDGAFTWLPGDASPRTIMVEVHGDASHEPDETLHVLLDDIPSLAKAISVQASGTILNDDKAVEGPPPAGAHAVPALSPSGLAATGLLAAALVAGRLRRRRSGPTRSGA